MVYLRLKGGVITVTTYTVGDVAKLAHVSVRTLHYYDEYGLLTPSARSEAGYRLYTDQDLERLQHVLFYKELGFGLEAIRTIMSNPDYDRYQALKEQRALIAKQIRRAESILQVIDKTLASLEGGIDMSKEEMFEVFGDFDPAGHEDEVKERWGETEAYKESARRTKRYTKDDWKRHKAESDSINQAIAALMDQGVAPTDTRALDAVERHRLLIDRWFYPCSRKMHAELGRMYVDDPRFTATYEKIRPGMAHYLREATAANAARGED